MNKSYIEVLKFYFISFSIVILIFLLSFLMIYRFGWLESIDRKLISLMGTALILGGTLGYLVQWKIQTWEGETGPEKLNKGLFMTSYIIGTLLIFLGNL